MFCHKCGNELHNESKFCNACGVALDFKKAETKVLQPKNNEANSPDSNIFSSREIIKYLVILLLITIVSTYYNKYRDYIREINSPDKYLLPPRITVQPSQKEIDSILINQATEIAKKCPIMVNKYTRLDYSTPGPGNYLTHNYTLININSFDFPKENILELENEVRKTAKNEPGLLPLLSKGISVRFRYFGKDKKLITEFTFSSKDLE